MIKVIDITNKQRVAVSDEEEKNWSELIVEALDIDVEFDDITREYVLTKDDCVDYAMETSRTGSTEGTRAWLELAEKRALIAK